MKKPMPFTKLMTATSVFALSMAAVVAWSEPALAQGAAPYHHDYWQGPYPDYDTYQPGRGSDPYYDPYRAQPLRGQRPSVRYEMEQRRQPYTPGGNPPTPPSYDPYRGDFREGERPSVEYGTPDPRSGGGGVDYRRSRGGGQAMRGGGAGYDIQSDWYGRGSRNPYYDPSAYGGPPQRPVGRDRDYNLDSRFMVGGRSSAGGMVIPTAPVTVDTNRDGKVSGEEAANAAANRFDYLDTDGSGELTKSEYMKGNVALLYAWDSRDPGYEDLRDVIEARWNRYEGDDNDGIATKTEFLNHAQHLLAEADETGDGEVSLWEYRIRHFAE